MAETGAPPGVVPAGTTDLNDVATATYTDQATGIPIPGSTTATASAPVQLTGSVSNATATITDLESITGTDFTFSADSFSGAAGTFGLGYQEGTPTFGPVNWTSATQNDSGSVTFSKTIYPTSGTTSNEARNPRTRTRWPSITNSSVVAMSWWKRPNTDDWALDSGS